MGFLLVSLNAGDIPEHWGKASFIDVETTGFGPSYDEILELSIILFAFDRNSGEIKGVLDEYTGSREPSIPIDHRASDVHGIYIHHVKGKELDDIKIKQLVSASEFIVAHNANFDRDFINAYFKDDNDIPWYCSMNGIDWHHYGYESRSLEKLLLNHDIKIDVMHRANTDARNTLLLISQPNMVNGEYYFSELLRSNPLTKQQKIQGRKSKKGLTYKSEFDKAIHTLEGLLKGIALDTKINTKELEELNHWCNLHRKFIDTNPFNELIPLIEQSLEDNYLSGEEKEDILWVCNNFKSGNQYYDVVTSDIQRLQGLLHGILSDNVINEIEVLGLKEWLNENEHLASTYPYDEVYSLVVTAMSDGKLDENEKLLLQAFFTEFIDTSMSYNINNENNELKKDMKISGVLAICPEIEIKNSNFCFTGESSRSSRKEIESIINSLGGNFADSVTKNTHYLVVGDIGNPAWAFSCYGRKVEKAMKMRRSGQQILIIHENDFWDAVEDSARIIQK